METRNSPCLCVFQLSCHKCQWKPLIVRIYGTWNIHISWNPPTPLLSSSCQTVIRSALWWGAQMPPEMQIMSLFCGLLFFFCVFFMSAFCHLAFSSSWLTHVHGQCFTEPRLSSLVLFHAVWLASSLCLLFPVPTRCAAHLLFMSACKATSAEANGTGTSPCSSVNNAFGTNLQSFKGIGGL